MNDSPQNQHAMRKEKQPHIACQTIRAMVEYRIIDGKAYELLVDDDGNKYLKLEDFGIEHQDQDPNPIIIQTIQTTQAYRYWVKAIESLTRTDYPRLNDIANDDGEVKQ